MGTLWLTFGTDFRWERSIDIVAAANLLIILLVTLALPVLIHPYTDRVKLNKEVAVGEINDYLKNVERVEDLVCRLPQNAISAELHKTTLFEFKRLRQQLFILDREVRRVKEPTQPLANVREQFESFWSSATDELALGMQLSNAYISENVKSSSQLQIALKELRYHVRS